MVGVPRSRGCRMCVQRRVRCDGARPICNNCKKGNRPCPGYGPGVKFQDEGPKLREKYNHESSSSSPDTLAEDYQPSQSLSHRSRTAVTGHPMLLADQRVWDLSGGDIRLNEVSKGHLLGFVEGKTQMYLDIDLFEALSRFGAPADDQWRTPVLDTIGSPTYFTNVFSPDTMQVQLLSEFAHAIVPSDPGFLPKSMRTQRKWLEYLPPLTGTSLLLDTAVRAVTLVHIGRFHNNDYFITESRPLYGKALKLLNAAIADPEMGMSNKTLCATILLSFYEMFSADNDTSWIRHAGGAGALMRLRGPERHRYGFDRDIFLSYRHTLAIESFVNDVPCFLDEPEWRTLTKDIWSDLLVEGDIPEDRKEIFWVAEQMQRQMAFIGGVAADASIMTSKIKQGTFVKVEDQQTMVDRLMKAYDNLKNLCTHFEDELNRTNYGPVTLPSNDPIMPIQYRFTNVFLASYYVGFRATLMLIYSQMEPFAESLKVDLTRFEVEDREHAIETCRCVEYMLISSFLGPFFTIFPLRFALKSFRAGEIERDWALCKLFEIGDRRMRFARQIPVLDEGYQAVPLHLIVERAQRRLKDYRSAYPKNKVMHSVVIDPYDT